MKLIIFESLNYSLWHLNDHLKGPYKVILREQDHLLCSYVSEAALIIQEGHKSNRMITKQVIDFNQNKDTMAFIRTICDTVYIGLPYSPENFGQS